MKKEREIERTALEDMQRRFEDIQKLTEGYEGLLYRMALIYRVALYDAFIPDLMLAVFLTQTNILKSSKTLTHEEIIEHSEKGTLIAFMADKVITPFSYASVDKQAEWIKDKLGIDLTKDIGQLERLTAAQEEIYLPTPVESLTAST